ncbi:MAG: hypothetical protein ACUVUF_08720 [Candidatus Bathycorpusculaceae bacterium]
MDGTLPGGICNYGQPTYPNRCETCPVKEMCKNASRHERIST